jgi:hypothetical protein
VKKIGINENSIVNVIHLRLEQDAIDCWSYDNRISREEFKNKLSETYIDLIKKTIHKEETTILLTYEYHNEVMDYLKNNQYQYFVLEKRKKANREINAIIDLLNSKHCNNVFIGVTKSTFSCTVRKIMKPKIIEWINVNNIK